MTFPASLLARAFRSPFPALAAVALSSALAVACDAASADDDDDVMNPPVGGGGGVSGSPSGGSPAGGTPAGGSPAGGSPAAGAGGGAAGAPPVVGFVSPVQRGAGSSTERYATFPVTRNGIEYFFMANGWGPGFGSQTVSWEGTYFSVDSMSGTQGPQYQPASYPTVFCGQYSDKASGPCGLPAAVSAISRLRTGWRWTPNGNAGQYNAAYDIWISNSAVVGGHSAYLMVWLRDPPGQQPAGGLRTSGVTVANTQWNIWVGNVNGKPCISYVRPEGGDLYELEFDVMDFARDAQTRQLGIVGTHIISVAVGFEIWNGPVTNLVSNDFYVAVNPP